MADTIRLRLGDPRVRDLIARTFPEYSGRRPVALRAANRYHMADFWDGGSRTYVRALDLATMRAVDPAPAAQTPMNRAAHTSFDIPDGVAMVEHTIYCGADLGISIVVNERTYPRALAERNNPIGGTA